MNSFLNKIKKFSICEIFLISFMILLTGYYIYLYYTEKETNTNKGNPVMINKEHFDNSNKSDEYYGNNNDNVLVTFYSFSYCGYCKKFDSTWEETMNKMSNNSNVKFRKVVVDTMKPQDKAKVPYFVSVSYAPSVILTLNGRNIKEFDQQIDQPMRGLDKFIESKGQMYSNSNSKHV